VIYNVDVATPTAYVSSHVLKGCVCPDYGLVDILRLSSCMWIGSCLWNSLLLAHCWWRRVTI